MYNATVPEKKKKYIQLEKTWIQMAATLCELCVLCVPKGGLGKYDFWEIWGIYKQRKIVTNCPTRLFCVRGVVLLFGVVVVARIRQMNIATRLYDRKTGYGLTAERTQIRTHAIETSVQQNRIRCDISYIASKENKKQK